MVHCFSINKLRPWIIKPIKISKFSESRSKIVKLKSKQKDLSTFQWHISMHVTDPSAVAQWSSYVWFVLLDPDSSPRKAYVICCIVSFLSSKEISIACYAISFKCLFDEYLVEITQQKNGQGVFSMRVKPKNFGPFSIERAFEFLIG